MSAPRYFQLLPGGELPPVADLAPFRAIVIVEAAVTSSWQWAVSQWLVQSGCLFMMAWGIDCDSWDDSVDFASLEQFDYQDIPDSQLVMTTWHRDVPLSEAFAFCKQHAKHPIAVLTATVLLHISPEDRRQDLLRMYAEA